KTSALGCSDRVRIGCGRRVLLLALPARAARSRARLARRAAERSGRLRRGASRPFLADLFEDANQVRRLVALAAGEAKAVSRLFQAGAVLRRHPTSGASAFARGRRRRARARAM